MKIRQRIAGNSPEPTIEMAHQDLFRKISCQNMYIESLYEIMTDRKIEGTSYKFNNYPTHASWVNIYLDENLKSLDTFVEKVSNHIEKIKAFAEKESVDISNNLVNMTQILKEYENDSKLQNIRHVIQSKKEIMQEWTAVSDQCSATLEAKGDKKYDNNIDTNIDLLPMKTFIDEKTKLFEDNRTNKEPYWFDYSVVEKYIDRLNKEHIEAFLKIRSTQMDLTMADNFLRDKQNLPLPNNITVFLQNKIDEEDDHQKGIKLRVELDGYRTQEIILFVDDSMLGKRSDGSYFDIFTKKQLQTVHDSIMAEYIRNTFNKNPTVAKNFIDILQKDESSSLTVKRLMPSIETYANNLDFFNNKPFDLKAEFADSFNKYRKDIYRVYEDLDDKLTRKIKDHKVNQYAHSIASNKYMHLYNEESYKIIEDIFDLKLKNDIFQDYIGKKIAAYKTPEQFNEGLSIFLKSFNGFDMQSMLLKAENAGVQIISESDDILIIEIDNYEQSKLLGSSSWCIVRDESYFNSYTGDGNKQYFIYDFSYESSDNNSMIGFTLDAEGEHYAAHYKDDDEVNENENILMYARDMVNELNQRLTMVRTAKSTFNHV